MDEMTLSTLSSQQLRFYSIRREQNIDQKEPRSSSYIMYYIHLFNVSEQCLRSKKKTLGSLYNIY